MTPSGVWVTRPGEGGIRTARRLAEAGYAVVHVPLLVVEYPGEARVPESPPPDWVVFVSPNAVAGFARALGPRRDEIVGGAKVHALAVGERTAMEVRALGFSEVAVPVAQRATGVAELLRGHGIRGHRLWIPAGTQEGSATGELPAAIEELGGSAEVFPVYRVDPRRPAADEIDALLRVPPGAVLLASPSAVRALSAAWGDEPRLLPWRRALPVTIGPVTAAAVREIGWAEPIECAEPSDDGLIEALAQTSISSC